VFKYLAHEAAQVVRLGQENWEYKGSPFNAKGASIPVAVSVIPGEAELDRAG